jgi:hypothetical protein
LPGSIACGLQPLLALQETSPPAPPRTTGMGDLGDEGQRIGRITSNVEGLRWSAPARARADILSCEERVDRRLPPLRKTTSPAPPRATGMEDLGDEGQWVGCVGFEPRGRRGSALGGGVGGSATSRPIPCRPSLGFNSCRALLSKRSGVVHERMTTRLKTSRSPICRPLPSGSPLPVKTAHLPTHKSLFV